MKTVGEVSRMTGVSVRTLHHYDEIGLLKPSGLTDSGYRLYDDKTLERLYTILLFRELEFPLKEIKQIMESPGFDPTEALEQQIRLLEKKHKHIGRLIERAIEIQRRGKTAMGFEAFDKSENEQYKQEALERWGGTEAYQEYVQRQMRKTSEQSAKDNRDVMVYLKHLGDLRHLPPESVEVQQSVKELQEMFTRNFYHCTNQILSSLGEMYVDSERFRQNIDRECGEGTAEFARAAIRVYCSKNDK